MDQLVLPPILDACCGPRMMWFDKRDARALFIDKRQESHETPDGYRFDIAPDVVADFTAMPFEDHSFHVVVFDPPHIVREKPNAGNLTRKYGSLPNDWRAMLSLGFAECFRVLKPFGLLVFKWAESDIRLTELLELTPHRPLFASRPRNLRSTHWCVFLKEPT